MRLWKKNYLLFVSVGRVATRAATTWYVIAFATLSSLLIDYRVAWMVWWTVGSSFWARCCGCCCHFSYLDQILIGMNVQNLFVVFIVVRTNGSSVGCGKYFYSSIDKYKFLGRAIPQSSYINFNLIVLPKI